MKFLINSQKAMPDEFVYLFLPFFDFLNNLHILYKESI